MKAIFAALIFWAFPFLLIAQYQLAGTVVNSEDNKPLQGASVFINNASNGTITNAEGKFILTGITVTNFELVVSFVNFKTLVVKITLDNINRKFRILMEPKPQELQEVIVSPVLKDGWEVWGRTFTDFFIGTSKNASKCVIKNPRVLRFRYDKKNQVLKVTSVDKLQIVNAALGLIIDYQLEEFRYEGKSHLITYYGYSSFTKMESSRKRKQQDWINKRREAYNGSLMHVIRALYNKNTDEEGFELRQLVRLYKNDSATRLYYDSIIHGLNTVFDTSRFSIQMMKTGNFARDPVIFIIGKQILSPSAITIYDSASTNTFLSFTNNLQVIYKNAPEKDEYATQFSAYAKPRHYQESIFALVNNRAVLLEKNGMYYEPLDLFTEGYIAWQKMAEMLPSDYEPGD